jgi:hypothetical protein
MQTFKLSGSRRRLQRRLRSATTSLARSHPS